MIIDTWLPLCVVTTCRPRLSLSVPMLIGTSNIGDIGVLAASIGEPAANIGDSDIGD